MKQTRGQISVEMRQMHMPKVIICWLTENLPVTMIIDNLIEGTYFFASFTRMYDKREVALLVYSNGLILVSLLCYHDISLI